ncbi:MAG: QcrA and Rieske domain-containing protein [Thermodesulfovibrionales bacterium]
MDEGFHAHDSRAETTRRGFFKAAIGILALMNGIALGIPFVSTLLGAAGRRTAEWSRLSELDSLTTGRPVEIKFVARSEDAYHHGEALRTVWVTRHSADSATVLSPVCTHLGCHYLWSSERERFECPCHASVFAPDGTVLYGPAPRPLDRLPSKVEDGILFVKWQRFKTGTREKIAV